MFSLVPIAEAAVDPSVLGGVLNPIIAHVIFPLVELLFVVAVLVFVYGVLQMVFKSDDADARTRGKWSILGGTIGIFIMLSAWGIIYIISNTVGQLH